LSSAEDILLDDFILKQRAEQIFILRKGALERYLPRDHASKDLEKLLKVLDGEYGEFWSLLSSDQTSEIVDITEANHRGRSASE
jgi:hypothetical protein